MFQLQHSVSVLSPETWLPEHDYEDTPSVSQEGHLLKSIPVSLWPEPFLYRVLVRCNSHINIIYKESF